MRAGYVKLYFLEIAGCRLGDDVFYSRAMAEKARRNSPHFLVSVGFKIVPIYKPHSGSPEIGVPNEMVHNN